MARFDTLVSRLSLRGRVEVLSGLHIGSGRTLAVEESEEPVAKDFLGHPVIPGSGFKGALRNQLEALLRGLDGHSLWSCDPLEAPCPRPPDDFEPGLKDRKKERERHWYRVVRDWDADRLLAGSCTVCRLFGSQWFGSKVSIPDLPVVGGTWTNRNYQHREGTAIERESDTAAEARRVEFEVVPQGTSFDLEILIENPQAEPGSSDADALGLLLIGLDAFRAGWATLGGKRAFGLGRVAVHLDEATVVTADQIISGAAVSPLRGPRLDEFLNQHRVRPTATPSEGTHVPSAS
ncbi:MAG: CRISPR-associated RAMP protein [Candidatus Riflebacteria bacterium]|nr:CRISPR-associated RAMP protein [Candidatus Riflebacteria bacterium]